jgi:hypothetical protein
MRAPAPMPTISISFYLYIGVQSMANRRSGHAPFGGCRLSRLGDICRVRAAKTAGGRLPVYGRRVANNHTRPPTGRETSQRRAIMMMGPSPAARPPNGLELPVACSIREAAWRLGQRPPHSRAFWQARQAPTFRTPAGSAAAGCWAPGTQTCDGHPEPSC